MTRSFFDSNVLVYAYSDDPRASIAQTLLQGGGAISTQCLNELANVLRRKQKRSWPIVTAALQGVRDQCSAVVVLDERLHEDGIGLARRYELSVYDGMIVAAALTAGCDTLYSEDMHAGLVVDGRLTIVNPFA